MRTPNATVMNANSVPLLLISARTPTGNRLAKIVTPMPVISVTTYGVLNLG